MNAYQKAKKKYQQLEYQFTEETGKCVDEHRKDYWKWLDAKGENTFGLLDPPAQEPEQPRLRIKVVQPPVQKITPRFKIVTPPVEKTDMKKLAGALEVMQRNDPSAKPLHQHIKENDERLRETLRQTAEWARKLSVS